MAQYANQKVIITHRENAMTSKKQYLAIETEHLATAARDLQPTALLLYLYLASNRDGFEKDFSPRDFSNIYGVSIDRARKAPEQLVDAGYLVKDTDGKYHFYEVAQEQKASIVVNLPKKQVPQTDGSIMLLTYKEVYDALKTDHTEKEIIDLWNSWEDAQ